MAVHIAKAKKDNRPILLISVIILALLFPFNIFCQFKPTKPQRRTTDPVAVLPDTIDLSSAAPAGSFVEQDAFSVDGSKVAITPVDSIGIFDPGVVVAYGDSISLAKTLGPVRMFNPDPTRAVWLSALFPGLGQIYNRRYWKLPIVIGGYMGLAYGTSWNNMMLTDYTKAYTDIMDNDPNTKSYMNFFPPNVKEEDLDKSWLSKVFKRRKDFYRRNRDLCIVCMVGVYLVAMVDAYVDASLAHFDITPDLSINMAPTLIPNERCKLPGIGLQCAINF